MTFRPFSYLYLSQFRGASGRPAFMVAIMRLGEVYTLPGGEKGCSHTQTCGWSGESYGLALLHGQRLAAKYGWPLLDGLVVVSEPTP